MSGAKGTCEQVIRDGFKMIIAGGEVFFTTTRLWEKEWE
jgi:hypothetical protein